MADIFQEVDEDVRSDQYRTLWKNYGRYALAGAIGIVVATAVGVAWREHIQSSRLEASERFEAAAQLLASGAESEAIEAFAVLTDESLGGYTQLAGLREALARIAAGDDEGAVRAYDRVADAGGDKILREFASLRAALLLMDTATPEELSRRLEPLARDGGAWRYSARELQAIVALQAGDEARALELFTALSEESEAPRGIRTRAGEMIDALGGTL